MTSVTASADGSKQYAVVDGKHPCLRLCRGVAVAALLTAAPCLGAEPPFGNSEQLERVFVGVPNQLTLPPGFPAVVARSLPSSEDDDPPVDDKQPQAEATTDPQRVRATDAPASRETAAPGRTGAPPAGAALAR